MASQGRRARRPARRRCSRRPLDAHAQRAARDGTRPAVHEVACRVDEVLGRAHRLLGPRGADQLEPSGVHRRPQRRGLREVGRPRAAAPGRPRRACSRPCAARGAPTASRGRRPPRPRRAARRGARGRAAPTARRRTARPRSSASARPSSSRARAGTGAPVVDSPGACCSSCWCISPSLRRAVGPVCIQYRTPVRCRQARRRRRSVGAMAARDRSARRSPASHRPPTRSAARGLWPTGPVPIPTGTVELVRDLDDPDGVTVLVNGVPSSYLDLVDPTRLVFEYMQQMAAVIDRVGDAGGPLDVVHLGAAGCALARAVDADAPRVAPAGRRARHRAAGAGARLVRPAALPRAADPRGRRPRRAVEAARRVRGRRRAGRLRRRHHPRPRPHARDGRRRWRGCCVPAASTWPTAPTDRRWRARRRRSPRCAPRSPTSR